MKIGDQRTNLICKFLNLNIILAVIFFLYKNSLTAIYTHIPYDEPNAVHDKKSRH